LPLRLEDTKYKTISFFLVPWCLCGEFGVNQ
jgi:hypothetical protein